MNVGELRAALEVLPDDMPVAVSDDQSVDPLVFGKVFWWRYRDHWGTVSDSRDGELAEGDVLPVLALVLGGEGSYL